jgi:hypothetical protein
MSKISLVDTGCNGVIVDIRLPDSTLFERIAAELPNEMQQAVKKMLKLKCDAEDSSLSAMPAGDLRVLLMSLIDAAAALPESPLSYSFSCENRIAGTVEKNIRSAGTFYIEGRPCMIECAEPSICRIVWLDVPWYSAGTTKYRDIRGVSELVDDSGVKIRFSANGAAEDFVRELRRGLTALECAADSARVLVASD